MTMKCIVVPLLSGYEMNPTIIVQQNVGIPGGHLTQADSKAHSIEKSKPVAAIIRPLPQRPGENVTLRKDSGNSNSATPHVRRYQLDDYVNWLREKIIQDEADTRETHSVEAVKSQPKPIPVEIEPVVEDEKTKQVSTAANGPVQTAPMFSTITTASAAAENLHSDSRHNSEPLTVSTHPSDPPPAKVRGFSTAKFERVDQPHAELPQTYVKFDELAMDNLAEALPLNESNPEVRSNPSAFESQPGKLSSEDTEKFIATISKAIASVLTETPELEFEQRVRSHFESQLQARAVRAIAQSEIESVDANKLDHAQLDDLAQSGGIPAAAMKSAAGQIAAEILSSAREDIPTNIAAWDVEDFRWPVVTNQMIVSGGEALNLLSQAIFDMITPDHQRVAIAGLGRGEGSTSIAISIARWAAACGKNVLLVDADLVTPSLSTQVGLAPNLSWINAVNQSLPPAEVIVRSQNSNLCVMPLAQMVSRVTWPRFIYDNLGDVIDQVRDHFDLVLFDVGPANQLMAELSRPSLLIDTTVLVHNGVNSPEFQKTKSRLEMFGLNKFIVAQNRTQQNTANVA